jgi:hypothetical protein
MYGLFDDDMAHASTSQKMIKKFMKEYSKDFEYIGGDFMTSFLGLEVEQDKGQIRLHLDNYVNEMLGDYKAYIKRDLKLKKTPMQPGVVLTKDDAPETPDPKEQKIYPSFVAKIQFVANWVWYDVSFAASQLPRFCASAGVLHWAALHHVMGYLNRNPSFKLVYQRRNYNGLDGSLISIGETVSHVGLQQD